MYIQFYTNTDPENPVTVAFKPADISSVERGSRKVTVVMNTGMAYTQEYGLHTGVWPTHRSMLQLIWLKMPMSRY